MSDDRRLFWISLLAFLFVLGLARSCQASEWTGVVVHHTASPCWTTLDDVDQWHRERGWDGIGYHYLITCDGQVHEGRSLRVQGAHALGRNRSHVGVALVGEDGFTQAQQESLKNLLTFLKLRFTIARIERHHEHCPGVGLLNETFN